MEVRVSFFGNLIHLAGGRTRTLEVAGSPPTVADLRAAIAKELPAVAPHLNHTAVAMGSELLPDGAALRSDQEISLLPPVSGGSAGGGEGGPGAEEGESAAGSGARIQEDPLSLDALLRETEGVDAGALVVFAGTVRAVDGEVAIAALDYDVHREMADRAIRRIEEELRGREGVLACRIVHRVGSVPAGEPSIYVVVRARHRPEAFEAARDGIDRVKSEAPIWKEDVHPDGTRRPRFSGGTPLTQGDAGTTSKGVAPG